MIMLPIYRCPSDPATPVGRRYIVHADGFKTGMSAQTRATESDQYSKIWKGSKLVNEGGRLGRISTLGCWENGELR